MDGLVRRLGSEDFEQRERASRDLIGMGMSVHPRLQDCLSDADPEVQSWIRRILARIETAYVPVSAIRPHPVPVPGAGGWGYLYSPDGSTIAAREWNGNDVFLLDADSLCVRQRLKGLAQPPAFILFSPDGRRVLAGDGEGGLCLWTLERPEAPRRFAPAGPKVVCACLSPDGQTVHCGTNAGTIQCRDAGSGRVVREWKGHTNYVSTIAVEPDGRRILSGGIDGAVHVWDAATGAREATWVEARDGFNIRGIAVDPRGRFAAIGGTDRFLQLRSLSDGSLRAELKGHKGHVHTLSLSGDGSLLASDASDFTWRIWDVATGREVRSFRAGNDLSGVALSPDGKRLVSGVGRLMMWDLSREAIVPEEDFKRLEAVLPDLRTGVSWDGDRNDLKAWDFVTGAVRFRRSLGGEQADAGGDILCLSGDGSTLVQRSRAGLRLVDFATGKEIEERPSRNMVHVASISEDGRHVLWSDSLAKVQLVRRGGATVRTWDLSLGKGDAEGDYGKPFLLCLAPGAGAVALARGTEIRVYDVSIGDEVLRATEEHLSAMAFTPDTRYLAVFSREHKLAFLDVRTGETVNAIEVLPDIRWFRFLADGTLVTVGSTVVVWRVR